MLLNIGLIIFGLFLFILWIGKKPSKFKIKQSSIRAGGLVGHMEGGTIKNSYSSSTIRIKGSPEQASVGGLVGSLSKDAKIENSSADSKIEFYVEDLNDILYNNSLKIWIIGGFFAVLFWLEFLFIKKFYMNSLSYSELVLLVILSLFIYNIIGANVLKYFSKIKDETFLDLIKLSYNKSIQAFRYLANVEKK